MSTFYTTLLEHLQGQTRALPKNLQKLDLFYYDLLDQMNNFNPTQPIVR